MGILFLIDWPLGVDLFFVQSLAGIASAYLGIRIVDLARARFSTGPGSRGPRPVRPPAID